MKELVKVLTEKHLNISSIESLTAGLFASKLAEVEHASAILKGALVTYMTSCKIDVLHVDRTLIETYGVISEECAKAMVVKGKEMFDSDIVVSFTGNAGPDVMDKKEVGLVHMGIYYNKEVYLYKEVFHGDRNSVRNQAVSFICNKIKEII